MIDKRFIYFIFIAFIVSCNSTSSFTEIHPVIFYNKSSTSAVIMQRMDFIESYISKIDFKANDSDILNINELEIQGDKRIITENQSEKNIVLRNNSIVRVRYKDHLANNFIKSQIFYYDNDKLICIKLYEILPNELNKATLYQRAIYFHDNLPILDTDELNQINKTESLVVLAQEYLKNEYLSLN